MEYRKLKDLKKLPNNPRTIKDESFKSLCKSIQDNPDYFEARPVILSDRTGELIIIAGNQRYEAAKHLKLAEIPTHLIPGLTEEREKEIIIRDNVANGEWDLNLLADWDKVKLEEWGVNVDWPVEEPEAVEDDYIIPNTIETDIVLGDLFEIGDHRLLCGDSTDSDAVGKLMNGEKADLVLTDPPYGIGYEYDKHKDNDNDANAQLVSDVFALHKCGKVWTPGLMNLSRDISRFGETKVAVWYKKFAQAGNGVGGASTWEPILILNPPIKKLDNDVIELMVEREELHGKSLRDFHSCPKPVKLYGYLVDAFSDLNHLIYEPFCGSGTTMIASHQMKRKCYGMEMSEKYCQVIIDRMKKLDPTLKITKNGAVI